MSLHPLLKRPRSPPTPAALTLLASLPFDALSDLARSGSSSSSQPASDIHIPLLSPTASLFAGEALSPNGSAASAAQQLAAVGSRRKRTFYISTPHVTHSIDMDEPAMQPVDDKDSSGGQQQQQEQSAAADKEWRLKQYVSLLGCVHEWSEIRMLRNKQLVIAPYTLLSC